MEATECAYISTHARTWLTAVLEFIQSCSFKFTDKTLLQISDILIKYDNGVHTVLYISLNFKQYRKCTYNVTSRRVQETIVAVEKQYYIFVCVCVSGGEGGPKGECVPMLAWVRECGCTGAGGCLRACSHINPTCNAPPYCHLRSLFLHRIV